MQLPTALATCPYLALGCARDEQMLVTDMPDAAPLCAAVVTGPPGVYLLSPIAAANMHNMAHLTLLCLTLRCAVLLYLPARRVPAVAHAAQPDAECERGLGHCHDRGAVRDTPRLARLQVSGACGLDSYGSSSAVCVLFCAVLTTTSERGSRPGRLCCCSVAFAQACLLCCNALLITTNRSSP